MIYTVVPDGLEPDPDYLGGVGVSWQCLRAEVVSVHRVPGEVRAAWRRTMGVPA